MRHCRRKMRMSGLSKVEMSAFMDGRGVHGDGAYRLEPTRTGATEGAARGKAKSFDAGGGSGHFYFALTRAAPVHAPQDATRGPGRIAPTLFATFFADALALGIFQLQWLFGPEPRKDANAIRKRFVDSQSERRQWRRRPAAPARSGSPYPFLERNRS